MDELRKSEFVTWTDETDMVIARSNQLSQTAAANCPTPTISGPWSTLLIVASSLGSIVSIALAGALVFFNSKTLGPNRLLTRGHRKMDKQKSLCHLQEKEVLALLSKEGSTPIFVFITHTFHLFFVCLFTVTANDGKCVKEPSQYDWCKVSVVAWLLPTCSPFDEECFTL